MLLRHVIHQQPIRPRIFHTSPPSIPIAFTATRCLASKRAGSGDDEAEIEKARKWLAKLDADTIRNNAVSEVSFSRSSGPGGQNVNKVSSKATLRLPTPSLLPLLPTLLHPSILSSRYHAPKSSSLIIQADDSRKQTENVNACWRKLHDLVLEAGALAVPGETSREQVERVKGLERADKARTRKMKEARSQKKTARRGGGGDGY